MRGSPASSSSKTSRAVKRTGSAPNAVAVKKTNAGTSRRMPLLRRKSGERTLLLEGGDRLPRLLGERALGEEPQDRLHDLLRFLDLARGGVGPAQHEQELRLVLAGGLDGERLLQERLRLPELPVVVLDDRDEHARLAPREGGALRVVL